MMIYMTTNLLECYSLPLNTCFNDLLTSVSSCDFTIAASTVRNSLSVNSRTADSFASFKRRLKPELFVSTHA